MPEKSFEELREDSHSYGEKALRLLAESKELGRKANLIKDAHLHDEAMQEVFKKDREALELIHRSNEPGSEIAGREMLIASEHLRSIRGE